MTLSKEAILGASDLKTETVNVPEWGGDVRIAVMSGLGRDQFVADGAKEMEYSLFQARLLSATIVDDSGNLLFSAEDVTALRGKSRVVLDRLTEVAARMNGMQATAVEDAAKNSDATASADSGSNSPSILESR